MGRSESKQVVNQGTAQSAQNQQNAQTALANTNTELGKFSTNLDNMGRFVSRTYGPNGDYMRAQNTLATTAAAAGSRNMGQQLALRAMRTGENTAGYAPAVAEAQRQGSRDLTDTLAQQEASRMDKLTALKGQMLDESKYPAGVQASLYGPSVTGSVGQLDAASGAAKTPGFWDTFAPALAQGAGAAAAGICACEGSLIRMADGTDKPIEQLRAGDYLWPLSTSAPPNRVLATPVPHRAPCFEMTTRSGKKHRGSDTHTIALAIGGYAYLPELDDAVVLAELGTDTVAGVTFIGEQTVLPLVLNGSHTYMADGIWVLA